LIAEMQQRFFNLLLTAMLQWGRDQLIAEIRPCSRPGGRRRVASMGPRSIDRGNIYDRAYPAAVYVSLQWGRDQLIAEIWWTC